MKIIASEKFKSRLILFSMLIFIFTGITVGFDYVSDKNDVNDVFDFSEDITVIIDPGHGGIDGGTSAKDGTVEKDINLSIALKLNDILKSKGFDTVMTREDDRSIHDENADTIRKQKVSDIKNRLSVIENTPNCLFVSIHQNYFEDPKYFGTQVFYSKNNPESAVLADSVRRSVIKNLQPDNKREIKQSGKEIYLLYHSSAPSIMVECGFLSNSEETEKLKNEEYQKQMALTVAEGISDFINKKER